ncbi:MAG TPA: hypothetical protein VG843_07160 [Rhizomicrobium sp.]|nr:hypothetical protein [Rhizomicrobium sp.]
MQKESDAVSKTEATKRPGQRNEVVVVHPDEIVGLKELGQRRGEKLVDRAIAFEVLAAELDQTEAEVQKRPQRAVGEADIEISVILFR